ncbi:peptidoglycan-binding domain-containing protein [Polaribacter septentrionalilitoris]|uniref:peptidoglycan-binding domain-containing protein n=1 Tax=Polaribacter septentrionalilitoris TaxID=2494657 RepID=UPI0013584E8F|nr:peptidoglycan-binding domain-containing protein [Polaribacter septentrionalilitoris]
MKQLIILLLLIIAFIIGFGKYQQYKRYNSPKVDYKTEKKLDLEYYNQELVLNYHKAIEDLNSFVMMQWTVHDIDVRTPEYDDEETKIAVAKYVDKLAIIKYYEVKLEKSASLKQSGLSNKEIQFLEETGTDLKAYQHRQEVDKIKSMFNANEKMIYGQKSALIYEVQKRLVANGLDIKVDGLYKIETLNAIKIFEEKNNLFADGFLDVLTLDALFK